MILISSAAYLQGDFSSEVGQLPPSLLPIGNKCLYEYQVEFLKELYNDEDIYLSLPDSYKLNIFDKSRINNLGVNILEVPADLSLAESILYSWNISGKNFSHLTILYGDTLFLESNFSGDDIISVHSNHGFYQRAFLGQDATNLSNVRDVLSNNVDQVISGFFSFSEPFLLMKHIVNSKNDFVSAVVSYDRERPLKCLSNGTWLDMGHINSFFQSRTKMTTQRNFNDLKITSRNVLKSSKSMPKKIYAEGSWYKKLPKPLCIYTPTLCDIKEGGKNYEGASYEIEYLNLLPLSDLFVFTNLGVGSWQSIFKAIGAMLKHFKKESKNIEKVDFSEMTNEFFLLKTSKRLKDFSKKTGFDLNKKLSYSKNKDLFSLAEISNLSSKYIRSFDKKFIQISHGDLCFSNILYDSRSESIKVIDPRGLDFGGNLTNYGDIRYDLAKLYHSVIGLYDLIITDRYSLKITDDIIYEIEFSENESSKNFLKDSFQENVLNEFGCNEKEILAISIQLFLSMLPLHSDNSPRQQAFIANSLRLFLMLREKDK